jgi:DtxR family Mn-dependent transcriptional regulator
MTKSLEDYVETVFVLIDEHGAAHVRDVAKVLNVKMPSVVKAISELKKMGYAIQAPYGDIKLTEKGEAVAREILGRHRMLCKFLLSLGVSEPTADKDACLMEHILSAETLECVESFLAGGSAKKKTKTKKTVSETKEKTKSKNKEQKQ